MKRPLPRGILNFPKTRASTKNIVSTPRRCSEAISLSGTMFTLKVIFSLMR